MDSKKRVFQVAYEDNVATALSELLTGERAALIGDHQEEDIEAVTDIPAGHKIALSDIPSGTRIIKWRSHRGGNRRYFQRKLGSSSCDEKSL